MGAEQILSQLTSSAVVVYAIEILKHSKWFPWLSEETPKLNRLAAVIGSFGAAVGIHFAYDAQNGALLITGLTVAGILHGAWHFAQQYALTQLAYDSAINPKKIAVELPKDPAIH